MVRSDFFRGLSFAPGDAPENVRAVAYARLESLLNWLESRNDREDGHHRYAADGSFNRISRFPA